MTKIEWCEFTWNPIVGCSKVSPGCANCYAEKMARRLKAMGQPRYQEVIRVKGWSGKITEVPEALDKPRKRKKPSIYFVNSMSDLFHPGVEDEAIAKVWEVREDCPQHTFKILTKRPERMRDWVTQFYKGRKCVFPNIHLGVSVETRSTLERIQFLADTPCEYRFLSVEPLLESVGEGLERVLIENPGAIRQIIVGGESGAKSRKFDLEWAREIREVCDRQSIAFFFKQGGDFCWDGGEYLSLQGKGGNWDDPLFPPDLKIRQN
jgi:protein gp37